VVKNAPITGQADDHKKAGAPTLLNRIQGVLNQIESAFNDHFRMVEGRTNGSILFMSSALMNALPATIESVKTVYSEGQISFKCGSTF